MIVTIICLCFACICFGILIGWETYYRYMNKQWRNNPYFFKRVIDAKIARLEAKETPNE